jgi:hypothetical protein
MADEGARVIKRKKIKLPGGDTVDVPVIVQITFLDVPERGQETQFTFDNTHTADRNVHVASILDDGRTDEEGNQDGLKVERIDRFRVLDAPDRGRETFPEPDNRTVAQPPDAPPYFTTHEKTHIVRYLNTPDDGNYIDSELIDQINFIDAPERGQESFLTLANPPDNDVDGITIGDPVDDGTGTGKTIPTIQVSSDVADITDSSEGGSDSDVDPPWRLDPFQNIVRYSSAAVEFYPFES